MTDREEKTMTTMELLEIIITELSRIRDRVYYDTDRKYYNEITAAYYTICKLAEREELT